MRGTITWYEISKGELPPANPENKYGYSKDVLLTNGVMAGIGCYCHGKNGAHEHWHFNTFHPTHWAYINYPE